MLRKIAVSVVLSLTAGCADTPPGAAPVAGHADSAAAAPVAPLPGAPASGETAPASGETAPASGETAPAPATAERGVILFLGTSLTAGYGVGAENAFPALIQAKIDSAGLPYTVTNAGISGETSAGGLRRLEWSLQQPVSVLVLELGANDGLRGLDLDALRANLDTILERTRATYPDVRFVIAGMEAPPNMGEAYTGGFRRIYTDLARRYDAALVPFLLQDVAGDRQLNIEDGIHPNIAGHRIVADNMWKALRGMLEADRAPARR
jgi:acyl-CoA thioesterase-1